MATSSSFSSSSSSSSSLFEQLFLDMTSKLFQDVDLDLKRMPVLVRVLDTLKARESSGISTNAAVTTALWEFISQHPPEMTRCKTYWHISAQVPSSSPSNATVNTTTSLFLTSTLPSSQQSVSVPTSSMSSLPSKTFETLPPTTKYSRLLQFLGYLSTLSSMASIHHNILESASFLLDSTHIDEICTILVVAILQGNSSDFVTICKPLFALPRQVMVKIFATIFSNIPTLVTSLVDIVEIIIGEEKKILSSSSSSSTKLTSVQLFERKYCPSLLALVSSNPTCIGVPLRYELMRRQLFPQLCIDITCKYLLDAENFVDSTILTPSVKASSSVGRWLVSALTSDMLDFVTTLSLDKLRQICVNALSDSVSSTSMSIDSINAPARVVSIVQLISAATKKTGSGTGGHDEIVFSERSHAGFIDCLRNLLKLCNDEKMLSEHRQRVLHVVYSMSLLRVAALAGCNYRDRNSLTNEVSSIAECIQAVLTCSKSYEKPLLHVFFSSLLGPSSELSILRDVLLSQLDVPLTLTETYLPMQWVGRTIKLLVEGNSSCIPSTEKDVAEHRKAVYTCVLSTPVPDTIQMSVTSLSNLGDWLSCLEIIFRNPKYVFDASKFFIHDKMICVIRNSALPIHASLPNVLSAWIRRVVFAKNRSTDIGQCLLPNEVQEFVSPLRKMLLTESSVTLSLTKNNLLPAILACYCTLLQQQFIDLGNTGEIKSSVRRDLISDPLISELQDLPLAAARFYLREWSKSSSDVTGFGLVRVTNEFEELVEKFRPEIRLHRETVMTGLEPTIASNMVRDFIERRFTTREDSMQIEDGQKSLKRPRNYRRLESMGCKELFDFGSTELVNLAIDRHQYQEIVNFDIIGNDSLDRLVAIFDIWQYIHQLIPCTADYQLATVNSILDGCALHESHSKASRAHIKRNAGAMLTKINSYDTLIREPILLFKLPASYVRNPFVIRIILFLLRGTLVASQELTRRILKRDAPQEGDPHLLGAFARWERSKLEYNVALEMYLPLQDIMVVRFLCRFVAIVGSVKREMDFHTIHLVSLFLEEFFTYATHFQECTLYHSILSHGIEEYLAFELMFSRPRVAVRLAEVLHNFLMEFNRFMPLPARFYYRDSISRGAASNTHDKVTISQIDGVSNTSPQRHFEGILRHLSYFFRLPYVCDELELIRKHIMNATCPFLIGALCMMEAPYLFDDIVNNCLKVVESIKLRDEDSVLKLPVKSEEDSQHTVLKGKFMGINSAIMKPCYPHVFETLKDMLMNIKGEDTSALKKFAYTLFGSDSDYHGFTPGLHLKYEEKAGEKLGAVKDKGSEYTPGVIEDYGKMVVEDVSWSATKYINREMSNLPND